MSDWLHGWPYVAWAVAGAALTFVAVYGLFLWYVFRAYGEAIHRIFEEKPLFLPPQVPPTEGARDVTLTTTDGRRLAATWLPAETDRPRGTVLFCHEHGGSRWLAVPYCGHLRGRGFNVLTFDFNGCGDSEPVPGYQPLHWVTEHEVRDVAAAVDHLKGRDDLGAGGVGVMGVSQGGGAALAIAARDRFVRAVVTDGAFATHGTIIHFCAKWIQIFVRYQVLTVLLNGFFYRLLTETLIWRESRKRGLRYPRLAWATRWLRQPLLMIAGKRDSYISPPVVHRLYDAAPQPKHLWQVPDAKHNQGLSVAGDEYRRRVADFFAAHLTASA